MSNATARRTKERRETETDDVTVGKVDVYELLPFEAVKEVAKRVLNDDYDVTEYSIRPYSDRKLGFLGSHYRLDVATAGGRKKGTVALSFFVKSVPYEVPDHADYVVKKGVFGQETRFYSLLMPLLREEYRGGPWAPTCHRVKENLMVFEDLSRAGYSMRDKLFDETLVRAGLSAIARLHAASLLAEARLGTTFDRLYPGAFVERAFIPDGKTRVWFERGVDLVTAITERLGHDPELVRPACERVYPALLPSRTKANVISHGDLWANNLMFNDELPPKCLLVDYQLLRYCPLAHDVAQFLYLCTDRRFRETWESAMLRHYYETLRATLNAHDEARLARIPSLLEVVEGMEEQRLSAVITATMYFPTVLMDENRSTRIMNDPASYDEFSFGNREKFVLANMTVDPVYERRINEAVIELAELASRLDRLPEPS